MSGSRSFTEKYLMDIICGLGVFGFLGILWYQTQANEVRYLEAVTYCSQDQASTRAEFILKCTQAANPLSDEDPEDWVRECVATSVQLFCERGYEWRSKTGASPSRPVSAPMPCAADGADQVMAFCAASQ